MVPGQHHVRMNMYIAQASNGQFKIVKNLGRHRSQRGHGPRRPATTTDARRRLIAHSHSQVRNLAQTATTRLNKEN